MEVGKVEPNVPSSLAAKLNQRTPNAPRDAAEAAERMAAASSDSSAPYAGDDDATSRTSLGSGEATPTGLSRVYVPTTRPVGSDKNPEYELRVMADGTAGIAVYTSVDRLRECLGGDQPWSEASLLELLYLVGKKRIGVALNPRMDPSFTPGQRAQPRAGS
jgi:hypothetical protein